MAPSFSRPGMNPTPNNAPHLSSFFKAKALPGMEREFKRAKDALVGHLANKPEIWKFMDGSVEGPQKFAAIFDKWDLTRTTLHRAMVDLSDRNVMIDLDSIGPWHLAEFRKGGDWEERVIAHAVQASRTQVGFTPSKPLPPPAPIKVTPEPEPVIFGDSVDEVGILGLQDNESPVEEPWEPETEEPTTFPVEETPMVKFTPAKKSVKPSVKAAPKKAAPAPKKPTKTADKVIAAAKSLKAQPVKKAVPALKAKGPINDIRAVVIATLLKRKFIKDAIASGHLTVANLKKTPTPRLEKMLERGSYKG